MDYVKDLNIENVNIKRVREPMDRNKLKEIVNNLHSDDDYVNYHLSNIEKIDKKQLVYVIDEERVEYKSGKKSNMIAFSATQAYDYISDYIDEGKTNSKPKEVMRNGYNKKSKDLYDELVLQEREEIKYINQFTQPSFDDLYDNIYVNPFNGDTYNMKNDELAVELRENVGVIIPGLIDNQEQYFDFVKRLKDRGQNGLGKTIYDRYEDYQEAVELISTYIEAVYDKYGGKEEFFNAKEMGGLFGGYEYIPEIRPRYKKNIRNIRLERGLPPVEYVVPDNLGAKIYEDGIGEYGRESCEEDYDFNVYEYTPPKFRDLPEDLAMLYKNDHEGNNGIKMIRNFRSYEEYGRDLLKSDDAHDIAEGRRIINEVEREQIAESEPYESEFPDIIGEDIQDYDLNYVIRQLDYDKLVYEYGSRNADKMVDLTEAKSAYKKMMENYVKIVNGWDSEQDQFIQKTEIENSADYATEYMYNLKFRATEDEKRRVSEAVENITDVKGKTVFGKNRRAENKKGNTDIETYILDLSDQVRDTIEYMKVNADTDNYSSNITVNDLIGYGERRGGYDDEFIDFKIDPEPEAIAQYAVDDIHLAERIYELTTNHSAGDMFQMRTGIKDFIKLASEPDKPVMTPKLIKDFRDLHRTRKGGKYIQCE